MNTRALRSSFVAARTAVKTVVFSCLWLMATLIFALPAAAQPLPLTSKNGCDVWVALEGEMELLPPLGSGGSLLLQKVGSDQLVDFVFDCVDFPPEPEVDPGGILRSVSICNWRMRENSVKGTTRAEVRWFPDPAVPGRYTYSLNGQIIRGTRYPRGVTSAQGEVDLAAGTVTADSFVAVLCRHLGS